MTLYTVHQHSNYSDRVISLAASRLIAYCKSQGIELEKVEQIEKGWKLKVNDYPFDYEYIESYLIHAQSEVEKQTKETIERINKKRKKITAKKIFTSNG